MERNDSTHALPPSSFKLERSDSSAVLESPNALPASPRGSRMKGQSSQQQEEVQQAKEIGVSYQYYQEMKEIFKIFDADGSGAIDPKEIREQMIALGFQVDNTTIYQLISDLDSDGSQKIEFGEFLGVLRDQLQIHGPDFNSRQNIKETFDFLDDLDPKNRDGKIDVTNLKRLATVLADEIPERELEVMVRLADKNGNGFVSPEDFYELMVGCATKMELQEEEFQRSLLEEASREDAPDAGTSKGKRSASRRSCGSSKTRDRMDSFQSEDGEPSQTAEKAASRKSKSGLEQKERSNSSFARYDREASLSPRARSVSPRPTGSAKDFGLGVFKVDRSGSVTALPGNVETVEEPSLDGNASDTLAPSPEPFKIPGIPGAMQQKLRQTSNQKKPRKPGQRKNLSLVPEAPDDGDDTPKMSKQRSRESLRMKMMSNP